MTTHSLKSRAAPAAETLEHGAEQAVDTLRDEIAPVAASLRQAGDALARRSATALREGSQQLRDRAQATTERGIGYVRDEPIKAVLMAAAAGAVLMALAGFVGRRH